MLYPAHFLPDTGGYVVTFRDIPADVFYAHAIKHGYHEVAERAAQKVRWLAAKGFA